MKKKFSKLIAVLLCLGMITIGFSGCGNDSASDEFYSSSEINSTLSMADEVQSFYDAVDTEYGYNLAYELAYNEDYWDNSHGWRTAGSDAEHKCADYLMDEMKEIGLTDVQKIGTKCDKFQSNDASLKIEGTEISLKPVSYQCSGTDGDLKAEIVDCGTGTLADYDGKDVKGKIVLVGVDQANESWIDNYILQAHENGAAALVTYTVDGYSRAGDDSINVQDICTGDYIPTTAISKEDADKVLAAIEEGNNKAVLNVDNDFEVDGGTTYHVVGKIKGKSSENRIIISGHYDKYWYGFQDDCAAIGLVYSVAKAMVDSEYVPENDIVFIAHGAEEWGASDSVFDWTTGAWGLIEKQKDWQNSTLAMINCELPAFKVTGNKIGLGCVPEYRSLASKLVNDTGLVVTEGDVVMDRASFDASTMEDGVTYRWHGVPYFINMFEDDDWLYKNYHTHYDNADTYDENTFKTNINWYGALAMYIDTMPALELDLTQTASDLEANLNDEIDGEAGVDVEAYKETVAAFKNAAQANNDKIAEINEAYEKAAKDGDEETMADLRAQGKEINAKTLKAFAACQPAFCKVDDFAAYYGHPNMVQNVEYLDGVIKGLENGVLWGEEEDGALDYAWQLNSAHDYNYMLFSKDVAEEGLAQYDPLMMDPDNSFWGYQRTIDTIRVGDATYELNQLDDLEGVDVKDYIKTYKKGRKDALDFIKKYGENEIKAMKDITKILK